MRALPLTFLSTAFLVATVGLAQTNPTARSVPFVEPFPSGTFSTYATGFQGWNGLSGAVINTQALAEASVPTGDATITAANPVTASVAGIYGSNGRVVLRSGSDATNGVNQLAMAINTTGQSGVRLGYSITSILAGPVTMGVVCQFRVGNTGVWATLTPTIGANPYVQTSGFTGLKTTVGVLLPAGCDNQPLVQVRWAVWRGTQAGNSAAFGIDDVAVTLIANDECSGAIDLPLQDPGNCPANALVGTTVGATDSGVDCVVSGTDVWYKITGDAGQAATVFLTPGTAAGLGIQVFGTCGGSVFYCQPGTQHGIFAGFGSTTFVKVFAQTPGTFTICAVRAPANNAVFFATPLPSQHPDSCTALPGTTDFATNDGTIPCGLSPSAADVWYAVDGGAGLRGEHPAVPRLGHEHGDPGVLGQWLHTDVLRDGQLPQLPGDRHQLPGAGLRGCSGDLQHLRDPRTGQQRVLWGDTLTTAARRGMQLLHSCPRHLSTWGNSGLQWELRPARARRGWFLRRWLLLLQWCLHFIQLPCVRFRWRGLLRRQRQLAARMQRADRLHRVRDQQRHQLRVPHGPRPVVQRDGHQQQHRAHRTLPGQRIGPRHRGVRQWQYKCVLRRR
ncbi:MAG: hypothetical protein IPH53_05700 [Flavobacteriales bacterium]|nr:hypothetical protein [Flavobacteriales bacterium]